MFGAFLFEAELAAGGVDVVAFFEAEGGRDVGVAEDGVEGLAVVLGGAAPGEALDGVVGDEVDLGVDGGGALGELGALEAAPGGPGTATTQGSRAGRGRHGRRRLQQLPGAVKRKSG